MRYSVAKRSALIYIVPMENFPIETLTRKQFPPLLREINDAPEKLYMRGTLPPTNDDMKYLSVVGSRKYTSYGRDVTQKLIEGLRGYPIVVVSGLALGIDSIAHAAALEARLTTLAIPGSGLNEKVIYPAINRRLAEKILRKGGALISEFEPNFEAKPWAFPKRNRIMAGMSHAVLVIEATNKSGTLITSRLATEYNRDVLAVPGSILSANSYGPHMLIKLGAIPVTSSEDILDALGLKSLEKEPVSDRLFDDLTDGERKVLEILSEPKEKDVLLRELGLPTQKANVLLSQMELKGLIEEKMGRFRKK